jgi:DNA repair exonuclease SbcCD ATPase subunit
LYRVFDSLSLLLKSLADLDVPNEVIVQGLVGISDEASVASQRCNVSNFENATEHVSDGRVAQLQLQLSQQNGKRQELEEELEEVREELEEMRRDDKAPEVLSLLMKVKEQANEIQRLKKRGEKEKEKPPTGLPRRIPRATHPTKTLL